MDFEIANRADERAPGVGILHYCEIADFDTIATLPSPPATQADKVTISDAHTFTGTNGFREIYTTDTMRELEANGFGEADSGGAEVIFNAFFPGSDQEFAAFLKDDPLLICIADPYPCNGALKYQIGTKCSPARVAKDWAWKSGKLGDGTKGFEFKIRAVASSLLFYNNVVTPAT